MNYVDALRTLEPALVVRRERNIDAIKRARLPMIKRAYEAMRLSRSEFVSECSIEEVISDNGWGD